MNCKTTKCPEIFTQVMGMGPAYRPPTPPPLRIYLNDLNTRMKISKFILRKEILIQKKHLQ